MELEKELKKILKGDVLCDERTREKYSRDASLFEIYPEVVVFPKDVQDIERLVRFVSEKRKTDDFISISPRSGGTDMTGGPLTESIVVDFGRYFNHIRAVLPFDAIQGDGGIATVEPGVYYRDFEKETLKKNLLLPSYPASREICMLGGMIANNSGGEKTLQYGKTEKYVRELRVVLAD